MKVKKVISLVLAVVMVFSLIPAQLIMSTGAASTKLGAATVNNVDVSVAKEAAYPEYVGLVDVALKLQFDYTKLDTDDEKCITAFNQVITIDPEVLSTVGKTSNPRGKTRGVANLDAMKTAIASSALGFVTPSADWALVAEPVPTWEEASGDEIVTFALAGSVLTYNETTNKLYVQLNGYTTYEYAMSYFIGVDHPEFLVLHLYLKLQDGKQLSDVKNAITLTSQEEVENNTPAVIEKNQFIANRSEGESPVSESTITFSSDFDPVAAEYTVTFTGIKNADGSAADDVVKTVSETDAVEAPELSGYSTDDYDYDFAGWDKDRIPGNSRCYLHCTVHQESKR